MKKQDIKNWLDTQNFESDTVGGLINVLLNYNLNSVCINESCETYKHISTIDDKVLLTNNRPIGYCNRTGHYVFPSDVVDYDGVCPALNENVDLGEFEFPNKELEENPKKFDWEYINYIKK